MSGTYHYYLLFLLMAGLLRSSLSCSCSACQQIDNNYLRCRCCHYHLVGGKRSSGPAVPPVKQTFSDRPSRQLVPDAIVTESKTSWRPDTPSVNPFSDIYFGARIFDKRQNTPAAEMGFKDIPPSPRELDALSHDQLLTYLLADSPVRGAGSATPRLLQLKKFLSTFKANEEAEGTEARKDIDGHFVSSSSDPSDPIMLDEVRPAYSPVYLKHKVLDDIDLENWSPSNDPYGSALDQLVLISRRKRDEMSTKPNETVSQVTRVRDQGPGLPPRKVPNLNRYFMGAFSGPPVFANSLEKPFIGPQDVEWSDLRRFIADKEGLMLDDVSGNTVACC